MEFSEIKLGIKVKDAISGFTGFVTSKSESISGSIQFGVAPPCDPKDTSKLPDAIFFDYNVLDLVDEGTSARIPAPDNTVTINLGEEVTSIVTGFKGTAVEKITHVNGCVFFAVKSKVVKNKDVDTYVIHHAQLKKTGVGVSKTIKPRLPDVVKDVKPKGGPNRSVASVMSGA